MASIPEGRDEVRILLDQQCKVLDCQENINLSDRQSSVTAVPSLAANKLTPQGRPPGDDIKRKFPLFSPFSLGGLITLGTLDIPLGTGPRAASNSLLTNQFSLDSGFFTPRTAHRLS